MLPVMRATLCGRYLWLYFLFFLVLLFVSELLRFSRFTDAKTRPFNNAVYLTGVFFFFFGIGAVVHVHNFDACLNVTDGVRVCVRLCESVVFLPRCLPRR